MIAKRVWQIILYALLIALMLSPQGVMAQADRYELTLRLLPGDFNDGITPGRDNIILLEVRNSGNIEVTNIMLSSDAPEGWMITFKPETLASLAPGASQLVDVIIVPASSTNKGNYTVNLIAKTNETTTATSAFLRVEDGTSLWLWVGLGVTALAILVFIVVFLRFGRR